MDVTSYTTTATVEKIGLTLKEAEECSGIPAEILEVMIEEGNLPAIRVESEDYFIRNTTIILKKTLEEFLMTNQNRNIANKREVKHVPNHPLERQKAGFTPGMG